MAQLADTFAPLREVRANNAQDSSTCGVCPMKAIDWLSTLPTLERGELKVSRLRDLFESINVHQRTIYLLVIDGLPDISLERENGPSQCFTDFRESKKERAKCEVG